MVVKTWFQMSKLLYLISACLAAPTPDCLPSKTVGDICFEFLYKNDNTFANCLDGCVYKVLNDQSWNPMNFCFATGNLPVTDPCLGLEHLKDLRFYWSAGILECPLRNVSWIGTPTIIKPASTWEKCGNLCYQDLNICMLGWTWTEESFYKGSCAFYVQAKLGPIQPGTVSGTRFCPGIHL